MAENDLVQRCVAGDEAAWSELVESYAGFVAAIVDRTLRHHGADHAANDAEGLVIETFAALAENNARLLSRYDPTYSLATYLRLIARSRTLSQLRRKRRDIHPLDEAAHTRAGGKSPEAHAIAREQHKMVARAVEKLPPREQVIVRMYHLESLSYAEIAELLDISINSVGPALSRAAARLREIIGDQAADEF